MHSKLFDKVVSVPGEAIFLFPFLIRHILILDLQFFIFFRFYSLFILRRIVKIVPDKAWS